MHRSLASERPRPEADRRAAVARVLQRLAVLCDVTAASTAPRRRTAGRSDGRTYGNGCFATCAGCGAFSEGACVAVGGPLAAHRLVFRNAFALLALPLGVARAPGACGDARVAVGGVAAAHRLVLLGAACRAGCDGCTDYVEGPSDCVCTKEYAPVRCGGKTYGNACLARCAGCASYSAPPPRSRCYCKVRFLGPVRFLFRTMPSAEGRRTPAPRRSA